MTITGSNTTNFGFQKLGSNDDAGYSTINEVVDGIDTILNASDRLIKASQTPTVAYVITGDGVDWVRGLVVTNSITDLAVTTGKINDLAVTTGKINDLAVTTGKIAADAVTLGTKTSGDYVATITGTANQIASSAATSGEGTTHTLSLVSSATLPGQPVVATATGSYPFVGNARTISDVGYVDSAVANVNASGLVALAGDVGGTAGATVIGGNKITNGMLATALQAFLVPTGTVSAFAGSSAPTGWLLCDGAAVSRTTYATLFGVVSTTYGVGDGSTTFNTPNLKGRTIIGVGTGTEITGVLGTVQGAKEVTLTGAESGTSAHSHPTSTTSAGSSHSHSFSGTTNNHASGQLSAAPFVSGGTIALTSYSVTGYDSSYSDHTHTFSGTTGGESAHTHTYTISTATAANAVSAHTNIQPSLPLNYIIKV